ncbi:MAG: hypothetical protein ACOZNI_12635 [Myxococcota bacterium]
MPRISKKITKQVGATATDYVTVLTTPWMLAFGAGSSGLRVLDERRALAGNYRHKVCWRTAEVLTDLPDAWSFSTNVRTTNGVSVENFTPTSGKLWVQAGIAASASSAAGEALASVQAAVAGKASIVASGSFNLEPDLNSSQVAYFPIGNPFPVLDITNLMFGVIVNGVNGTILWQPAVRYMDRTDDAGSWNDLGGVAGDNSTNANARVNPYVNNPISPGTVMYGQVGIKVSSTTARGTFDVIAAAY